MGESGMLGDQAGQSSQPIALGCETIFLVEDDEMVRGLARSALERKRLQSAPGGEWSRGAFLSAGSTRNRITLLADVVSRPE